MSEQLYDMVHDGFGRGPFEPDTLENWKQCIEDLCHQENQPIPDWNEWADGTVHDRGRDNITILVPVPDMTAAARVLGRKGGSVRGGRKAEAVRRNGRLGGRPRTKRET